MASSVDFASLSESIPAKIARVTQLLQQAKIQQPTFNESGAVSITSLKAEPKELIEARNQLINQANDLLLLARGPIDHVVSLGKAGYTESYL